MDGSKRWLVGLAMAALLAACDAKPTPTRSPEPTSGPTPIRATTPRPTSTTNPTMAPSAPPTSIDLPSGFDSIAWARMPAAADTEAFVVTFGVLGKPATGTRTYPSQPFVSASGHALLIDDNGSTEIVDARTAATIATFNSDALHLSLKGVDPNDLRYSFVRKFVPDVEHGYLYDLSANRSGLELRRFDLHGAHRTVLATLAPDPGRDLWSDVDFVVADDGTLVATACPDEESPVADHRCRLYVVPVGASGPFAARHLPAGSPRPCFLIATDAQFLIASQYRGCRADGGADQFIPYMALDLKTLHALVTDAPSDIDGDGIEYDGNDVGPLPALIANIHPRVPYGSPYPAIAVHLGFGDSRFTIEQYVQADEDSEGPPDQYADYVWAIRGRGAGWTLLHGYGPEFARCAAGAPPQDTPACDSGPEQLVTSAGRFELPPATWGDVVPPYRLFPRI